MDDLEWILQEAETSTQQATTDAVKKVLEEFMAAMRKFNISKEAKSPETGEKS